MKNKYYSLEPVLKHDAHYYVLFGERSNGKTFGVIKYAYERWILYGEQLAIIRRWDSDFTGANSAKNLYDMLIKDGNGINQIKQLSDGAYDGVEYYGGRYYLTVIDEKTGKAKRTDKVIAHGFSLNNGEHYKGSTYPDVKTILFDEFIASKVYLTDEFVWFQQLLSTIIRDRDGVRIFMCGNTINKYNPYFSEMGLVRAKTMKKGTIDIYEYGDSALRVAVQYTDSPAKHKKSDVYFAFNDPRLKMVTSGDWQIEIYPHCPRHYLPKDVVFYYYITFDHEVFRADIVSLDNATFTFIHRKTTSLQYRDTDLIFDPTQFDPHPYRKRNVLAPTTPGLKRIASFYAQNQVYYADNEVGNTIAAYLEWCKTA